MVNLKKLGRKISPLCPTNKKTKRGKSKRSPSDGTETPEASNIKRGERRKRRSTARSRLFSENRSWVDLTEGVDEGEEASGPGRASLVLDAQGTDPDVTPTNDGLTSHEVEEDPEVFEENAAGSTNMERAPRPRSVLLSEDSYSTPQSIDDLIQSSRQ